jgi:hypothetical protein
VLIWGFGGVIFKSGLPTFIAIKDGIMHMLLFGVLESVVFKLIVPILIV